MATEVFALAAALALAAATTSTLLFQQDVLADKPSNPNCVGQEFSFFAKNTPRGAGDDASALAHEEEPGEGRGLGDDIRDFREREC